MYRLFVLLIVLSKFNQVAVDVLELDDYCFFRQFEAGNTLSVNYIISGEHSDHVIGRVLSIYKYS